MMTPNLGPARGIIVEDKAVIIKSNLTDKQIIEKLQKLREFSYCPKSNFSVAALLRFTLKDGTSVLVGGANCEVTGHSTSALHAEQVAYDAAITEYGADNLTLTGVYVMGAMKNITATDKNKDGDAEIRPCGHCLQIICQEKHSDALVYTVTVNGNMDENPHLLKEYLQFAFNADVLKSPDNEKKLNIKPSSPRYNGTLHGNTKPQTQCLPFTLETKKTFDHLSKLTPLIINLEHETNNPTTACMLRVAHSKNDYSGVLVQEMGFQTTYPVSAAFARRNIGEENTTSKIDEIHLYSPIDVPPRLTSDEIETIAPFTELTTKVCLYNKNGLIAEATLDDCIQANSLFLWACFGQKSPEVSPKQNPSSSLTL